MTTQELVIYDFNPDSKLSDWRVVNDGVMGGLSQGQFSLNSEGHGKFEGSVSLENYGGFTSIRLAFEPEELVNKTTAVLKVKGDKKAYQFRIKAKSTDYFSYIYTFESSDEWEEIPIPLDEMYPGYRGRKLEMPNYSAEIISEISILIANKKAENFSLEIDKIVLQ